MKKAFKQAPLNFSKISKTKKDNLVHVKYIEVKPLQSSKVNASSCFHPISRVFNH